MMSPDSVISSDIIQKYIRGELDEKETAELRQLLNSNESHRFFSKIIDACRRHYPARKNAPNNTISFEQIDNILLEFLSDTVREESVERLVYAVQHEPDFVEKLQLRLHSNVSAADDSEAVSLADMDVLSDDVLLQKMGIAAASEQETESVKKENFIERTVTAIADFITSLSIPKPAYYLVPVILIALFVSFESTLFFADRGIIDDYALDKWEHYQVDISTLRSTDDPQLNPEILPLINSYRMALSSFIAEDYKEANLIFDDVIAYTQSHSDIPDDLKFDIYFMSGISNLSFAMTDEETLDDKESLKSYLNATIIQFTEAQKYIEGVSDKERDALYYYLGLGFSLKDDKDNALQYLEHIKDGFYLHIVENLRERISQEK